MTANNQTLIVNCTLLAARSSFTEYVRTIRLVTDDNFNYLDACKTDVCNALWGTGNPDISGVGMIGGYIFESVLGFLITIYFAIPNLHPHKESPEEDHKRRFHSEVAEETCNRFFDCAIYFCASIQIASLIVLARKDFGISANGLGGLTIQITWATALLSILPLIYPLIILRKIQPDKRNYRFFLFGCCWLLFNYSFLSQMIGNFGPSQVGQGKGDGGSTIVTDGEWNTVTGMCLGDLEFLSPTEQKALNIIGAIGSIFVSLFGFISLLWLIIDKQFQDWAHNFRRSLRPIMKKRNTTAITAQIALVVLPVLIIPQFWGIFRLRALQQVMADKTSNVYIDNQWTFGQVIAMVVFAPVLADLGHSCISERRQPVEEEKRG